jgi:hypothetical protein
MPDSQPSAEAERPPPKRTSHVSIPMSYYTNAKTSIQYVVRRWSSGAVITCRGATHMRDGTEAGGPPIGESPERNPGTSYPRKIK